MSEITKFTVNGREYDSLEQVPEEFRDDCLKAVTEVQRSGALDEACAVGKDGVVAETFNLQRAGI